ncbi:hypothetical protein ACVWZK_005516 [Bradyrhizobium sp. GM0.4]
MAYEKPPCTANQVDKAGKYFFNQKLSVADRAAAINAIWGWRTAHSYPLNALHTTLRNRALRVDDKALTAQRLKRLPSILRKLGRQTTMQMSQMQDIGGCRAIVENMNRLNLLQFVYDTSPLRHALNKTRDYIADPKDDGYRSIHHMYRFSGKGSSLPWHNLRIEVQIRTKLQHSWATCVETVDAFSGEDLKFGKGASDWRRFFQLMGTVHARLEKTKDVANTPKSQERLLSEVKELEAKLQVIHTLRSYAQITQHIMRKPDNERRDWFLIQMKPAEKQVLVQGYPISMLSAAKETLAEYEQQFQGSKSQAALVATNSLAELKKAYPNYFADTTHFIAVLEKFLR